MLDLNGCCADDILEGRNVEEDEGDHDSEDHGREERQVLFFDSLVIRLNLQRRCRTCVALLKMGSCWKTLRRLVRVASRLNNCLFTNVSLILGELNLYASTYMTTRVTK
jgi:hypothetical protein